MWFSRSRLKYYTKTNNQGHEKQQKMLVERFKHPAKIKINNKFKV